MKLYFNNFFIIYCNLFNNSQISVYMIMNLKNIYSILTINYRYQMFYKNRDKFEGN